MPICCKCKKESLINLHVCCDCYNDSNSNIVQERTSVLIQALRLALRHINKSSGITDDEAKKYIETVLKIY